MFENLWIIAIAVLLVWELIWKAFGLWHSARKNDKFWFVVILLVNLAGLVPILYLGFKTDFFQSKKAKAQKPKKKK